MGSTSINLMADKHGKLKSGHEQKTQTGCVWRDMIVQMLTLLLDSFLLYYINGSKEHSFIALIVRIILSQQRSMGNQLAGILAPRTTQGKMLTYNILGYNGELYFLYIT